MRYGLYVARIHAYLNVARSIGSLSLSHSLTAARTLMHYLGPLGFRASDGLCRYCGYSDPPLLYFPPSSLVRGDIANFQTARCCAVLRARQPETATLSPRLSLFRRLTLSRRVPLRVCERGVRSDERAIF